MAFEQRVREQAGVAFEGMFKIWSSWLACYRTSVHPWDFDDRPLLGASVRELDERAGSSVVQ